MHVEEGRMLRTDFRHRGGPDVYTQLGHRVSFLFIDSSDLSYNAGCGSENRREWHRSAVDSLNWRVGLTVLRGWGDHAITVMLV